MNVTEAKPVKVHVIQSDAHALCVTNSYAGVEVTSIFFSSPSTLGLRVACIQLTCCTLL